MARSNAEERKLENKRKADRAAVNRRLTALKKRDVEPNPIDSPSALNLKACLREYGEDQTEWSSHQLPRWDYQRKYM